MIEGTINLLHEAVVSLRILGPDGRTQELDAVVDTGYNGFLTLPTTLVVELELPFAHLGEAILANGEEIGFDVHHATVLWDGLPRVIQADVTGGTPLIGMLLLDGYDLNIKVKVGGRVVIQADA